MSIAFFVENISKKVGVSSVFLQTAPYTMIFDGAGGGPEAKCTYLEGSAKFAKSKGISVQSP